MSSVRIIELSKHFDSVAAVDQLSLEVQSGELVALLGPSGCGKTTTMRMIAGLLTPTHGDIHFDGRSVLHVPAERRGAVMVFQKHLLFPHMNVGDNVGFGLKMRGVAQREIAHRVSAMLEMVRLPGYEKRRAHELSGGQQQRVALARALVIEPTVLLLDEPLANLDANLRLEMRKLIRELQQSLHITTLFVTHDQEEAVMLADRVALLVDGHLQQFAVPRLFYEQPANMTVARFFRNENFLPGEKVGSTIKTAIGPLSLVQADRWPDGPIGVTLRPEQIVITEADGVNVVDATVTQALYMGTFQQLTVSLGSVAWRVHAPTDCCVQMGDTIRLHLSPSQLWCLPSADLYKEAI